jgi:hypothetical protein
MPGDQSQPARKAAALAGIPPASAATDRLLRDAILEDQSEVPCLRRLRMSMSFSRSSHAVAVAQHRRDHKIAPHLATAFDRSCRGLDRGTRAFAVHGAP